MSLHEELSSVFRKRNNNTSKSFELKNKASPTQFAKKLDLQRIVEFLNTTSDIDIQAKLFSTLSAYLITNNSEIDVIITSNAIYTKIHNVLAHGLPRKATQALNFLSALLYMSDEESVTKKRTMTLYAQNMIRVSGCLATMADMFSNCMMYHDTWKALCQCLAVTISGSEANQSYCTHLVPVCIRRCNKSNIDIFLVLQSLLYDHDRNVQLFLDADGTSIFTRELLQYDNCMQLLTTVVQSSTPAAIQIACKTNVLEHLRDFLHLYGQSQISQRAQIILNHIKTRVEGSCKKETTTKNMHKTCSNVNPDQHFNIDDTTRLMHNVMSEILNWSQNKDVTCIKRSISARITEPQRNTPYVAKNIIKDRIRRINGQGKNPLCYKVQKIKIPVSNTSKELSFSFLQNPHFGELGKKYNSAQKQYSPKNNNDLKEYKEYTTTTLRNSGTMHNSVNHPMDFNQAYMTPFTYSEEEAQNTTDLKEFQPVFASTPKKRNNKFSRNNTSLSQPQLCQSSYMASRKHYKSHGIYKRNQEQQTMEIKQRSISTRLFEAINNSCTTFVNSVKSIFKPRKSNTQLSNDKTRSSEISQSRNACNYSFTNYMRKRDAVLNKEWTKRENIGYEDFSRDVNSCNTCNDTLVLKRKLFKDDHLKQTVKKLKLGINLYGCDFKKISKTMWPRENYMTPVVLYKLYRKLIVK